MKKIVLFIFVVAVLSYSSVMGGDFYLINVGNYGELETAKNVVGHASGMIGGKFIVSLDAPQTEKLERAGIKPERIMSAAPERLCLVQKSYVEMPKTPLAIVPLYVSENRELAELDKSQIDILLKADYVVIPLTGRQTPFFYNPPMAAAPLRDEYPSDTVANLINQDSLYNYVTRLEAFRTRYIETDSIRSAMFWIQNKFLEFGYSDVDLQLFLASSSSYGIENYPCFNVVCIKPGTAHPERLIVICAHYDTYNHYGPSDNFVYAPGADDNATGTAAVMELARIFHDIDMEMSLMFIPLSAEEIGLIGAHYMADSLKKASSAVEFVLNFDMLGNVVDGYPDLNLFSYPTKAYYNVLAGAASRIAGLVSVYRGYWNSSDDAAFGEFGFNTICEAEGDFSNKIHTDYDVSSYLDFGHMTKLVKTAAAAIAIVDQVPQPIPSQVYDVGDGYNLRIIWNDCRSDWTYRIAYGTSSANLHDTVNVPPLTCTYDLGGLTEGMKYYLTVIGIPPEGLGPLSYVISEGIPLSHPRTPSDFAVDIDSSSLTLNWKSNNELDFDHYKILRRETYTGWMVLNDNYPDTFYLDNSVSAHKRYHYTALAVDGDLNESDSTAIVNAVPATFDGGVLLVEETHASGNNPGLGEQEAYYDSVFSPTGYDKWEMGSEGQKISRSIAGQYNQIFWVDDDDTLHLFGGSLDTLSWYFGFETDFFLAGWESIHAATGQRYFYAGDFYHDELGLSYIGQSSLPYFVGATGVNDWPDLQLKYDPIHQGRLPRIDIFTAAAGANVIYTYNSNPPSQFYGGKPVGIAYDTHRGKRVVLGFPLYYLTVPSAQALIARVLEYFAEESVLYGDVNGDWSINILDVSHLIGYLYKGGPAPIDSNNGDPNGSCSINILDVSCLINYLYKGGQAPVVGCVN